MPETYPQASPYGRPLNVELATYDLFSRLRREGLGGIAVHPIRPVDHGSWSRDQVVFVYPRPIGPDAARVHAREFDDLLEDLIRRHYAGDPSVAVEFRGDDNLIRVRRVVPPRDNDPIRRLITTALTSGDAEMRAMAAKAAEHLDFVLH